MLEFFWRVYRKIRFKITNIDQRIIIKGKRASYKASKSIFVSESAVICLETNLSTQESGKITIGDKSFIRGNLEVQRAGGIINVGKKCYIGDGTRIWSAENITIGDNVLIAHNCNIFDNDTHPKDIKERRLDAEDIIWNGIRRNFCSLGKKPVIIEDDVWIGANVSILKGVSIGKGSIIGTGSVVTSNIPAESIAVGNPAKVIKKICGGM
ncbi:acyltransferase [Sporolactobacillus sp. CQH2019]|uniref:acyltransferase n=1 Tax=Sporolactobacillus sp. CQH2019 TaxID=3023512 RepID=UPI0023686920|nr:acyltransferase [Sporolactobacillus sp. CQH2019]MDD9148167.1 acyltransferase [Sporolactobacillus sp. CQH2019]